MKFIIATDSFKGSLSAEKACRIITDTISEHLPDAQVITKPMADGGEGTAKAMIAACNGIWIPQKVMGPLPEMTVETGFAWFENTKIALVEMACASGIELLNAEQLDPLQTTTYGTGQLIKAAAKKQPKEIFLAIGGSATVDMGIGVAMAQGWRFFNDENESIGLGGGEIEKIKVIIPPIDKILCKVKVLSDVDNPLYGPNGAAEVFGPQKGADPEMVKRLDSAIRKLSDRIYSDLGVNVSKIPGAGAAGGLGAGAVAFMGAEIVSGIDTIINAVNLKEDLQDADWIITGEGKFDTQSLNGKVIADVVKAAQQTNIKVAVIAGDVQLSKSEYSKFDIIHAIGLKKHGMTTEYTMQNCEKLLKESSYEFTKFI